MSPLEGLYNKSRRRKSGNSQRIRYPLRALISAKLRCAQYHPTRIAEPPSPYPTGEGGSDFLKQGRDIPLVRSCLATLWRLGYGRGYFKITGR